ncbi:hypothetical protein KKA15_00035 [Patescibacteria group bacterium]|nr:hypothetical protein [Patescibacteria group bacterium]
MAENLPNNKLTNWQLKFGYWYVSNKLKIKKSFILGLIGLNVLLFGFSIISVFIILVLNADSHQQLINSSSQNLIDYEYFHERNKPKNLILQPMEVMSTTGGRFDILAKVKNPNPQWHIPYISYQFISGSKVLSEGETFILPNEEKIIISFGNEEFVKADDVVLNVSSMQWRRISDYTELAASRLRFDVSDIKFITSRQSGLSSRLPVSQTRFNVKNNSAYNFWEVGFYVVLYSGSLPVAVNYTNVEEFGSGKEKVVSINWYETLPPISRTEVIPEIDILDGSVYKDF